MTFTPNKLMIKIIDSHPHCDQKDSSSPAPPCGLLLNYVLSGVLTRCGELAEGGGEQSASVSALDPQPVTMAVILTLRWKRWRLYLCSPS